MKLLLDTHTFLWFILIKVYAINFIYYRRLEAFAKLATT